MPIQLDFILRRLVEMAEAKPELRDRHPWKAAYERDFGCLGALMAEHYAGDDTNVKILAAGILAAYEGISVEDFEAQSEEFLHSAQHPTLGRGYLQCSYKPMVELVTYLEANTFSNYIASSGGRDFMRPISEEVYGIPRERVIGSAAALAYEGDKRGGTITHKAEADYLDDGPEKPIRIWSTPTSRPCACSSCTTTASESSTTPPGPSKRSSRPTRTTGRWSASRTTGPPSSELGEGSAAPGPSLTRTCGSARRERERRCCAQRPCRL